MRGKKIYTFIGLSRTNCNNFEPPCFMPLSIANNNHLRTSLSNSLINNNNNLTALQQQQLLQVQNKNLQQNSLLNQNNLSAQSTNLQLQLQQQQQKLQAQQQALAQNQNNGFLGLRLNGAGQYGHLNR